MDGSANANESVYFIVTNLEHNVPSRLDETSADMYVGSTVGELGCWVDPAVTRIVQTGVEHSRVPDVHSHLGIGVSPLLCYFQNLLLSNLYICSQQ